MLKNFNHRLIHIKRTKCALSHGILTNPINVANAKLNYMRVHVHNVGVQQVTLSRRAHSDAKHARRCSLLLQQPPPPPPHPHNYDALSDCAQARVRHNEQAHRSTPARRNLCIFYVEHDATHTHTLNSVTCTCQITCQR